MKKRWTFIILYAVLMVNVYAQKLYHYGMITKGSTCLIVDNNINVRANCSTNSEILFQLDASNTVTILDYCNEEMYVEGAWSYWYKISCHLGEGYILGRWMTSIYGECDLTNGGARLDYVACQFYYETGNEPESDWDIGKYVRDEILFIRGKSVKKLTGHSLLQHDIPSISIPCTEIQIEQNSGLETDWPIVLFLTRIGYGAGYFSNCSTCLLSNEQELIEICYLTTCNEPPYFKNQILCFPNKTYDIQNKEWNERALLERGKPNEIVVITQEGEKQYDKIIKKTEKETVYRWNGRAFYCIEK